jgi:hypothetical protein
LVGRFTFRYREVDLNGITLTVLRGSCLISLTVWSITKEFYWETGLSRMSVRLPSSCDSFGSESDESSGIQS